VSAVNVTGESANSSQASATPAAVTATAVFVRTDATTQGSWRGVYGSQGAGVIPDSASYPAYAQVTPGGQSSWTWAAATADSRAPQHAVGSGRVAACWFNTTFTVDVNLTDGAVHQVALYSVDWDDLARVQRVDVLDAGTGAVLDSRTLTGFQGGQYLVWNLGGHVTLRVTKTGGLNAVVSGLFFD